MPEVLRRLEHKRRTNTRKRHGRSAVGTGGFLALALVAFSLFPPGGLIMGFIAMLAILSVAGALIGFILL